MCQKVMRLERPCDTVSILNYLRRTELKVVRFGGIELYVSHRLSKGLNSLDRFIVSQARSST